ncbi:MAG: hypothetical protein ACE5KY_02985 [Candidatus Tectimicrobiota bacterium]
MRYVVILVAVAALVASPLPVGAQQQQGGSETLKGAVTGGLLGAAGGALIGTGIKSGGKRQTGKGALIGAGAGALIGGTLGAQKDAAAAQQRADQPAYSQQQPGYGTPPSGVEPQQIQLERERQRTLELELERMRLENERLRQEMELLRQQQQQE